MRIEKSRKSKIKNMQNWKKTLMTSLVLLSSYLLSMKWIPVPEALHHAAPTGMNKSYSLSVSDSEFMWHQLVAKSGQFTFFEKQYLRLS